MAWTRPRNPSDDAPRARARRIITRIETRAPRLMAELTLDGVTTY